MKNLFALDHFIYFFSDAPYLLKTSRNCLYHSGYGKCTRYMWNSGLELVWGNILDICNQDQDRPSHLLPPRRTEHIHLTSYSVMRVCLAAQVLSATMASVIRYHSDKPDYEGTAKFCEFMDKFFDCTNVRSCTEGQRALTPFRMPYTSIGL